jgi:hypothetical protein
LFPNEIPTAFRFSTTCSLENCKKEVWIMALLPFFEV